MNSSVSVFKQLYWILVSKRNTSGSLNRSIPNRRILHNVRRGNTVLYPTGPFQTEIRPSFSALFDVGTLFEQIPS